MATELSPVLVADFETSLATAMAVGATTATLLNATDDDGVALPNGLVYLTLDGNNSQKEHISAVKTGTSLASIKSVSRQGVGTSGCVRPHRVGAKVIISDFAHIKKINDLLDGTTNFSSTVTLGYDGAPTITTDNQLATKKYADDLAYISGSPNMDLTTKGIGEEATQAEIDAGTQTGSTSAQLVVNPKYLKDSIYYTQLPTANQKAALAGTGTPSATDVFVNQSTITGMISMWGGAAAPTGWLLCDGSSLLRAGTYANLFAIIGTTYGFADGTHFTLPNMKGKVVVGYNASETEFDALGETGGEKTHTLTTTEIPTHDHTFAVGFGQNSFTALAAATGPTNYSSTGNVTTSSVGSGTAHNNLQPYITLNYIIKY